MSVSAIDGTLTDGQQRRRAQYAQMKGESGVLWPTDHMLEASPAPDAFVVITPGGCSVLNTYVPDSRQVYITEQETAVAIPWPATGSSPAGGVDRYVIQRVIDPQYPNVQEPEDPDNFEYAPLEIVNNLNDVEDSYEALWKIHQPANNTVFDPSDPDITVKDLRRVANPLKDTVYRVNPRHQGDVGDVLNTHSESGEWFPNSTYQDITIPEWATRMDIIGTWTQVRYASGKNPYGRCWIEWGPKTAESDREMTTERFGFDSGGASNSNHRTNWIVGDNVYIPRRFRGTTQRFVFKAYYEGPDEGVSMDGLSGTILQVNFYQEADPSSS